MITIAQYLAMDGFFGALGQADLTSGSAEF